MTRAYASIHSTCVCVQRNTLLQYGTCPRRATIQRRCKCPLPTRSVCCEHWYGHLRWCWSVLSSLWNRVAFSLVSSKSCVYGNGTQFAFPISIVRARPSSSMAPPPPRCHGKPWFVQEVLDDSIHEFVRSMLEEEQNRTRAMEYPTRVGLHPDRLAKIERGWEGHSTIVTEISFLLTPPFKNVLPRFWKLITRLNIL